MQPEHRGGRHPPVAILNRLLAPRVRTASYQTILDHMSERRRAREQTSEQELSEILGLLRQHRACAGLPDKQVQKYPPPAGAYQLGHRRDNQDDFCRF